jgi:hypothetical protein
VWRHHWSPRREQPARMKILKGKTEIIQSFHILFRRGFNIFYSLKGPTATVAEKFLVKNLIRQHHGRGNFFMTSSGALNSQKKSKFPKMNRKCLFPEVLVTKNLFKISQCIKVDIRVIDRKFINQSINQSIDRPTINQSICRLYDKTQLGLLCGAR